MRHFAEWCSPSLLSQKRGPILVESRSEIVSGRKREEGRQPWVQAAQAAVSFGWPVPVSPGCQYFDVFCYFGIFC